MLNGTTFIVNDAGDFTDDGDPNVTSLREAIDEAENTAGADIIRFASSLDGQTINLSSALPTITESVDIAGKTAGGTELSITIDAGGGMNGVIGNGDGFRVFEINLNLVTQDTEVKLDNLTITGGDEADEGGGIFFYGDPNAANVTAKLTITNSIIKENHSDAQSLPVFGDFEGGGGGLYAQANSHSLTGKTEIEIIDTEFSGNTAADIGGGFLINLQGGSQHTTDGEEQLKMAGVTVTGNTADKGGGGFVSTNYSSAHISRSTISGNFAVGNANQGGDMPDKDGGAGLYLRIGLDESDYDNKVTISETTISNNEATMQEGGGVFAIIYGIDNGAGPPIFDAAIFEIRNSTVTGNKSKFAGAGLYVCEKHSGTFIADHTTITTNSTDNRGGGISLRRSTGDPENGFDVDILHSTITGNRADEGGGVYSSKTEVDNYPAPSYVNAYLSHTIVSGNRETVLSGNGFSNLHGVFDQDSRRNLIGPSDSPYDNFPINDNGNEDDADNIPGLGTLRDNGGPTFTMLPQSGSQAIDQGDSSVTAEWDQRGEPFSRKFGPAVDIGAVENGAPHVIDVEFDSDRLGTQWAREPISMEARVAEGKQLLGLPVEGIDTIRIYFSEDVDLNGTELSVTATNWLQPGALEPTEYTSADFDFDDKTAFGFATWKLKTGIDPFANGKYAIHLEDDTIVDADNNKLDGEWANPFNGTFDDYTDDKLDSEFRAQLVSGDGVAGVLTDTDGDGKTDFRFHFAVLAGDYNQTNYVDAIDWLLWDRTYGESGTALAADGDGDGVIDDDDFDIWEDYYGVPLPLKGNSEFYSHDPTDDEEITAAEVALLQVVRDMADGKSFGDPDYYATADGDGNGTIDNNDIDDLDALDGFQSAWYMPNATIASAAALGPLAQVTNVIVSGSASQHDPFSFDTVDGTGDQLRTVPVGAADTISIVFSEDVYVDAYDLHVVGLTTAIRPNLVEFDYDVATYTASWRFDGWALGDQYLISLVESVSDFDGNWVDGEWTNPASLTTVNGAISEFPSGDGTPGGRFNFVLTLLPGDADLDGMVDSVDAGILFQNWGVSGGALFVDADFNGDGVIDQDDWDEQQGTWGMNLQDVWLVGDLDGDYLVETEDLDTIIANSGMTDPEWEDGDLDGDGDVDLDDFMMAQAQHGFVITLVF